MNTTVLRALLLDALHQVLDNKVFRILVVVIGLLVLLPLLLGFKETGVEILFGAWSFPYATFIDGLGGMLGGSENALSSMTDSEVQEICVQLYQGFITDGLMGNLGIFICLAATAFFIPQMIEKGAADTIFSKPVSRLTLLLARYITGVLFVGLLSTLLVVGTHLSLLAGSGISDPAFLWNALTLTYQFSLLYALTVLVGVLTRSTVASILLSVLFLFFNGFIHLVWTGIQMGEEGEMEIAEPLEGNESSISISVNGEERTDEELILEASEGDPGWFITLLWNSTQVLHYSLPKTGDAETIAAKLRGSFGDSGDSPFKDEQMAFELKSLPPGFESFDPVGLGSKSELFPPADDGTIVFAAREANNPDGARLLIYRRAVTEAPSGLSGRMRRENSRAVEKLFEAWLAADESRQQVSLERLKIADGTTWSHSARDFRWTAFRSDKTWNVRTLIAKDGDWFGMLQLEVPEGAEENEAVAEHFGGRDYMFGSGSLIGMQAARSPSAWYAEKLDWTAEWKYSIWFSIGSSLGFVLICLALAGFRLSRIDF